MNKCFYMYYFTQRKRRESASSSSSIKKVKKPWHEWLFKLSWTSFGSILSERMVVVEVIVFLMTNLWHCYLLPVHHPSIPPASLLPIFSRPTPWHRPPLTSYFIIPPPLTYQAARTQMNSKLTEGSNRHVTEVKRRKNLLVWHKRMPDKCMTKWIWMPLETGIEGCLLFLWLPPGNGKLWKSVYLYICHSGFYQQSCSYRDRITLSYKSLSFSPAHSAYHL